MSARKTTRVALSALESQPVYLRWGHVRHRGPPVNQRPGAVLQLPAVNVIRPQEPKSTCKRYRSDNSTNTFHGTTSGLVATFGRAATKQRRNRRRTGLVPRLCVPYSYLPTLRAESKYYCTTILYLMQPTARWFCRSKYDSQYRAAPLVF